jgi:hypothetical protein
VPWADLIAEESRRLAAARGTGTVYRPSDPRWRIVTTKGSTDPILVEEPTKAEDAIDERIVATAVGKVDPRGAPVVAIEVKPERQADVARLLARWAGAKIAVLGDGTVREQVRWPPGSGERLEVPTGAPPAGVDPGLWARLHAVMWSTGRIPRPLRAMALAPEFLSDPRPDNPFAKVAVALGERSRPMLMRLVADGPSWGKASASWALEQMGSP